MAARDRSALMMHVVARRRFSPHGAVAELLCGESMPMDDAEPEPLVGEGPMCDVCLSASEAAGVTVAA